MNSVKEKMKVLLGVCVIASVSGCATVPPLYLNQSIEPKEIKQIALMPVIDARENAKKPLKLGDNGGVRSVKVQLHKRKYRNSRFLEEVEGVGTITKEMLESPTAEWLQRFGAAEDDWIYFLFVEKLSKKHFILQSYGSASVHGYLFSRSTGELFWEGQADAKVMIGYLMYAVVDDFAVDKAVHRMMKSFPKNE